MVGNNVGAWWKPGGGSLAKGRGVRAERSNSYIPGHRDVLVRRRCVHVGRCEARRLPPDKQGKGLIVGHGTTRLVNTDLGGGGGRGQANRETHIITSEKGKFKTTTRYVVFRAGVAMFPFFLAFCHNHIIATQPVYLVHARRACRWHHKGPRRCGGT